MENDKGFACNVHTMIYQNSGPSTQITDVTVREHCGGNSRIYVVDAKGNVVNSASFTSPTGTATFSVAPGQSLYAFCDGGTDLQGCNVTIAFK
jgi:hypothetical protein